MDIKVEEASRVQEKQMRTHRAMHGSRHGTVPSLINNPGDSRQKWPTVGLASDLRERDTREGGAERYGNRCCVLLLS